jgi:1-deoxy-D-xylulose-5-phosphate reductoisomerase
MKKKVAILGSTGSIGTQALEVIRKHRDLFEVEVLTAGRNAELLIEQALQFVPSCVVIADESQYADVREALSGLPVKVHSGTKALSEVVTLPEVNIVLTAMVGFSGLSPTIAALKAGKNLALANKETLVVAGALITQLAKDQGVYICPVDSEHSAIFQCLAGELPGSVEKLILTASGGPFRGMTRGRLEQVTCREALIHPNWCMGNKITIDSASLMNKGLEVIEASWLFGMKSSQIEVVIHPQSVIHSLVQFTDGSIKAQLGLPDMRLPIQYALGYPLRLESDFPRFSFAECSTLTFEKPDEESFRNLSLAYEALRRGGNLPCVMNAANEVVVEAFLEERVKFLDMPGIIEETMGRISFIVQPTLEEYAETDRQARIFTRQILERRSGRQVAFGDE